MRRACRYVGFHVPYAENNARAHARGRFLQRPSTSTVRIQTTSRSPGDPVIPIMCERISRQLLCIDKTTQRDRRTHAQPRACRKKAALGGDLSLELCATKSGSAVPTQCRRARRPCRAGWRRSCWRSWRWLLRTSEDRAFVLEIVWTVAMRAAVAVGAIMTASSANGVFTMIVQLGAPTTRTRVWVGGKQEAAARRAAAKAALTLDAARSSSLGYLATANA
eukprot:COSAG02_NODE_978_length_15497_cov_11.288349_5_plen_221_part_00